MNPEIVTYTAEGFAEPMETMTIKLDDMIDAMALVEETPKKKKVMITPSSKITAKVADKPTGKPQYMVSVDGHTAPMMVHTTVEAAKKEAERLINSEKVTSNVRILMVVGTYKPKHEWEDWL